jgi:DNA-binding XRE family transcriptional regulator
MGRKPKEEELRLSNRIERGEYSPSLVLAFQIARALETPVQEIYFLEEEEK